MQFHEGGKTIQYFYRGLTNDNQAQDNRLLGAIVGQKIVFTEALDEDTGIRCGLAPVIEIVGEKGLAQTG